MFFGVLFGQVEQGGDGVVGGDEGVLSLGTRPEDGFVVVRVAIGVFGCDLGFADAAEAADGLGRLRESSGLAAGELVVQFEQQVLAAGEKGIAGIGDIPDIGQGGTRDAGSKEGKIFDGETDTGGDVGKGFVLIAPGCDEFSISWQGL